MHLLSTSAAELMANKAAYGSEQISEDLDLEQKYSLMLVCCRCKSVLHAFLIPQSV